MLRLPSRARCRQSFFRQRRTFLLGFGADLGLVAAAWSCRASVPSRGKARLPTYTYADDAHVDLPLP
jgi:hypothetical protein